MPSRLPVQHAAQPTSALGELAKSRLDRVPRIGQFLRDDDRLLTMEEVAVLIRKDVTAEPARNARRYCQRNDVPIVWVDDVPLVKRSAIDAELQDGRRRRKAVVHGA